MSNLKLSDAKNHALLVCLETWMTKKTHNHCLVHKRLKHVVGQNGWHLLGFVPGALWLPQRCWEAWSSSASASGQSSPLHVVRWHLVLRVCLVCKCFGPLTHTKNKKEESWAVWEKVNDPHKTGTWGNFSHFCKQAVWPMCWGFWGQPGRFS